MVEPADFAPPAAPRRRHRATSLLQYASETSNDVPSLDQVARTLQSLDTDGDGKVGPSEIQTFAISQGLDAAGAAQELSDFDTDRDGSLNYRELAGALGATTNSPAVGVATALPKPLVGSGARYASPTVPARLLSKTEVASGVQVRGGSAHSAATSVVDQLVAEQTAQQQANSLDKKAAELRANAASLSRQMAEEAMNAGTQAANQKSEEILSSMTKLEKDAREAEIQAASLRAKAAAELKEAQELMQIADDAMHTTDRTAAVAKATASTP